MEFAWFFIAGFGLGALVTYLHQHNKKLIAEYTKIREDITAAYDRLSKVLCEWQKKL